MNEELNNLLEANSYNITDQAGNKLTVIDLEDAKRIMIQFAKEEAIEAFLYFRRETYYDNHNDEIYFPECGEYLKERFDENA